MTTSVSTGVPFGVHSMTGRLEHALVQAPHPAFGEAFADPDHGFLHPVGLDHAVTEHRMFVELLSRLGVTVHQLDALDAASPDLVYTYDPALVTDRGAILLRSGKKTRIGEEEELGEWFSAKGIPIVGSIEPPGAVDGGDVFWLRPDLVCAARTLRTNQEGIRQLVGLLDEEVGVFDMPYDAGPAHCLHLLSVISPIADDLAVVELRRLPAGLYRLLEALDVRMIPIPDDEVAGLACNVLAIEPMKVVMLDGNPVTRRRMGDAGVEVHTFQGHQICVNGGGGPTCLTRPIRRR